MRNTSAVPVPRNQSTVPISNGFGSSSNIEDVIEKIECLRLSPDREASNQRFVNDKLDEIGGRASCERVDVRKAKLTESFVSNRETSSDNDRDRDRDNDRDHDQDNDLIERGPMKLPFSPIRSQPYSKSIVQPQSVVPNENFAIDSCYNSFCKIILGDKQCREMLNTCLDQLQNENALQASNLKKDPLIAPTPFIDEQLLLEDLRCGNFQAGQHATEKNFHGSPFVIETRSFSRDTSNTVISRSENHGSGHHYSPASAISAGSLQITAVNSTRAPCGSPNVTTASTYRPAQILSYSSNSSSSSSSQSYADVSSPSSSYRTVGSLIEEGIQNFEDDRVTVANTLLDDADNTELFFEDGLGSNFLDLNEYQRYSNDDDDDDDDAAAAVTKFFSWRDASFCSPLKSGEKKAEKIGTTDYTVNTDILLNYAKDSGEHSLERSSTNEDTRRHGYNFISPETTAAGTSFGFVDLHTKELPLIGTEDDSEIPKMVAAFESSSRQHCDSDRNLMLWTSLKLPSGKASERLKEKLDPKEVEKAMNSLLKRSENELAMQDKDGDTMLMCLVADPDELVQKMAYLVPLVERLSRITGALKITNNRGEDALYLAALNCPQFPFVTGYLAATMLNKGIDVSQLLYHTRGDTLIHSIAAQGDSHEQTLAELLDLKTDQGNGVFDLSKRNYDGKTALHVAIESHEPFAKGIASLAIVKLLLKHGADPRMKKTKCGSNALHMSVSLSCDPILVKLLLDTNASDLVYETDYNHRTPLHVAEAISNNIPLERREKVRSLLNHAGIHTNLSNCQGKRPLVQ